MQNLPEISLSTSTSAFQIAKEGNLENTYKPFKNLQLDTGELTYFKTDKLNYNIKNPVSIQVQSSYDGSVNLILNDDLNPPRLINSRFSVNENNTYSITDHSGVNDTNIYSESSIELDTRLYKTITKTPKIKYLGLDVNGKMKCGTYNFYFKYSDADGNETDFIGESGIVTCHIGGIKDPKSIRMGLVDEDSKKIIKFNLSNLDTQYDYLKVYYTRTTSDNSSQDVVTAHVIDNRYLIKSESIILSITGFENIFDIDLKEINPTYELVGTVKSHAQCQNMLFFGNINKPDIPYQELIDLSLRIVPEIIQEENIGNVDYNYIDRSGKNSYEYYNTENIYNYLGYWPEEYYRFGIVYLMNDFTLSPVFNTRGLDLTNNPSFLEKEIYNSNGDRVYIEYDDNGFLTSGNNFENSKGVIKMPKISVIKDDGVYPLGIKFNFQEKFSTNNKDVDVITELKKYTKGFFFVRQERIPTIIAQGCSIGKTKNGYGNIPVIPIGNTDTAVAQSFLNSDKKLDPTYISIDSSKFENKALIVPEAVIREPLFNQLFTSSKYQLTNALEQSTNKIQLLEYSNPNHYYLIRDYVDDVKLDKSCNLTIINDNLKLTTNGKDFFSARSGEAEEAYKIIDVNNDWTKVPATTINDSSSFVRGIFGTYVGVGDATLEYGKIFNIRPENYSDSDYNKNEYFISRFSTNEPFIAINDRTEWNNLDEVKCYRGDCYVGNFSHRIHRNFIDPDLPLNDKIVDINTWNNNFKVIQDSSNNGIYVNRILLEYKQKESGTIYEPSDAKYNNLGSGLSSLLGGGEDSYKIKGCNKINRTDVNSVELGHWFTFKTMANINVSMRDVDKMQISEQSLFGKPRSFHPYQQMNNKSSFKIRESNIINGAANVTLSKKYNILVPDVPFIKNKFDTRIIYSDIYITDAFSNGFRIFRGGHYKDLPKTYGSLTSIIENSGNLIATMENGVLLIPVNERLIAAEGSGGTAYINTSNVIPDNPRVLSSNFGSTWKESVLITINVVYGVDTVAKKIWKTNGQTFEIISDLKVQKFLNDNINLNESDKIPIVGLRNVKTHYNAFKGDVMFTFYNNKKIWNLCYNEKLEKFTTFYSWCPSYSDNINNIFFSFDLTPSKNLVNNVLNNESNLELDNYLWKHGQAGIYDLEGNILPTKWYGKQELFEFEFIVKEIPNQKIFNNLQILSNKSKPKEFEFEIVGEGYDWFNYKNIIKSLNDRVGKIDYPDLETSYFKYLQNNTSIKKLPFIKRVRSSDSTWESNTTNVWLVYDKLLNEEKIHTNQLGNDIKLYGRVKGNMEYLEDLWNIEIRPINFKYAYINSNNELSFTKLIQHEIRDKYLKIKVRYSGEDLTIIHALKTLFLISHA